ncbi:MAG: hypothetical protein IH851_12760 [Armatimonadetes bacterium]|nr:hypothetical protein [Armatimonadota bacterium]
MGLPPPVFMGYYPKCVYVPEGEGVDWGNVKEICSVSDCISDGVIHEDHIPWHTFNRAFRYNSQTEAVRAAGGPGEQGVEVFAYSIYPVRFTRDGKLEIIDLDDMFDQSLPALPDFQPDPRFKEIGFDVVAFEFDDRTFDDRTADVVRGYWGCSPLSCNGYASQFGVNRCCLIDDLATAVEAAKCFQREQPEPGEYFVVRVNRAGGLSG